LLHHANKLVSWLSSEGLVPFRPNISENPEVNYQHVPIRALYQLQQLIQDISEKKLTIDADVYLYQSDQDPVVEPSSVEKLNDLITAKNISVVNLSSEIHGVVYRDIDQIQRKICVSIL